MYVPTGLWPTGQAVPYKTTGPVNAPSKAQ
jgi:hypothetical protein